MTPRNLPALDAANLGLVFIHHYATLLATAIEHLPDGPPNITAFCHLLLEKAENFEDLLQDAKEQAEG